MHLCAAVSADDAIHSFSGLFGFAATLAWTAKELDKRRSRALATQGSKSELVFLQRQKLHPTTSHSCQDNTVGRQILSRVLSL
jgi:hypothetical protein